MAGPLIKKGWRSPKQSTIADLRQQVKILYPDESTRDQSGAIVDPWVNPTVVVAAVWARVEPVSGRELLESGQMQADVTHRVIMRLDPSVFSLTPKHRIIWLTGPNNNILNVAVVLPTAALQNNIEVLCIEEV